MSKLYVRGGETLLVKTLHLVRAAWPEDGVALGAALLGAVGEFVSVYEKHPRYSGERLVVALGGHSATAVKQALRVNGKGKGERARYARSVMLDIYNFRLTANALPEATQSDLKRLSLGHNPWKAAA